MKEMVLESCHSTWVFELYRKRFCRVLKGIEISHRAVSTGWRPYSHLEIVTESEEFHGLSQRRADSPHPFLASHRRLCAVRRAQDD